MQKLKLTLISALTIASLFSAQESFATTCKPALREAIRAYGSPSTDRREITDLKILPAGEAFHYGRVKTFGPYPEAVLIALVSGSYHSGYFVEAFILSNSTCEFILKETVYSE